MIRNKYLDTIKIRLAKSGFQQWLASPYRLRMMRKLGNGLSKKHFESISNDRTGDTELIYLDSLGSSATLLTQVTLVGVDHVPTRQFPTKFLIAYQQPLFQEPL